MKKLYISAIALLLWANTTQAQELVNTPTEANTPAMTPSVSPEIMSETPQVVEQPAKTVSGRPSSALKPAVASESSFFIRIYGSYGIAMPGAYNSIDFYNNTQSTNFAYGGFTTSGTTVKDNKVGLGQGLRFGGGIGYILNDFINLGLDVDYYQSGSFLTTSVAFSAANIISGTLDAKMLTFTPNVTFKAISADNYYIYNRLGINVGLPKVTEVYSTTSPVTVQTYEFQGGIALGYLVGIGVQFRISNALRAFVELNANSTSYAPQKRVLTAYTEAGVDKFAAVPASIVKTIEYFDNLTAGAGKSVTLSMPFTSLGLQVGVAYRF
jgi:hypothetical protein